MIYNYITKKNINKIHRIEFQYAEVSNDNKFLVLVDNELIIWSLEELKLINRFSDIIIRNVVLF